MCAPGARFDLQTSPAAPSSAPVPFIVDIENPQQPVLAHNGT